VIDFSVASLLLYSFARVSTSLMNWVDDSKVASLIDPDWISWLC